MKKILMFLLLGVFCISFASAEYYIDIYADSVTGAVGSVTVTDMGDYYRVNATNGNYEVDRALVMKWLFYGTTGSDPRATSTYITNPTVVKSLDNRDKGKRGVYAKLSALSTNSANRYYTCTFSNTVDNYNVSSWSDIDITGVTDGPNNWEIPSGSVVHTSTSGSIKIGTDTSSDDINNPSGCQIELDNFNRDREIEVILLSRGVVSWVKSGSGIAVYSNTDFYINESFPEFAYFPELTINSIDDNYETLKNEDIIFNITSIIDSSKTLSNISLYINGILNETKSLSGTEDTETFTKLFSEIGSYNWSVRVCDNESICTFLETRNFKVQNYKVNAETHNSSTYETSREIFTINLSTYKSLNSVKLIYNGTQYTTTQSENEWSYSMDIPTTVIGNNSYYYKLTYNDLTTDNTQTYYQNVEAINLTHCITGTPYINFTFKDESNLSIINATIPTSTTTYWLGNGDIYKTLTYINNTANYNYPFCFTPIDKTLNTHYRLQYASEDYPQRTFESEDITLTNETTNKTLYLLGTADGLYVTFQVINPAEQTVSGVSVTATREIDGEDIVVANGITGDDGGVTFWLNPDFVHDFTFVKDGYETYESSYVPTQSSYTITLGGETTVDDDYNKQVGYSINPQTQYLDFNTTYTFNFNLTSSYWDIQEFGFILVNGDGDILGSDSESGINDGSASLSLDISENETIIMNYYWKINDTYINGSKTWIAYDNDGSGFSIAFFFEDLAAYMGAGMFGLDNFGLGLISFVICFSFAGVVSFKFGLNSPASVMAIICAMVGFLDVGVGIVPNPVGAITNFPTIFVFILTIGVMIKEGAR